MFLCADTLVIKCSSPLKISQAAKHPCEGAPEMMGQLQNFLLYVSMGEIKGHITLRWRFLITYDWSGLHLFSIAVQGVLNKRL